MRRRTLALAAVMAAATIVPTALPARAQSWPLDCLNPVAIPPLQSVVRDAEGVHFYPEFVDEDVDTLVAWALDRTDTAFCLENGIVTTYAFCMANKGLDIADSLDPLNGDLRYVAYDGGVHVRYPLLLEDLEGCQLLNPL